MIRIWVWRLGFELLHLAKRTGWHFGQSRYFAYGGNLDPEVTDSRGMRVLNAQLVELPNFALRFNHPVPFRGIGMASVVPESGASVLGVVYTLPLIDEWIMDCFEGHFFLKRYLKNRAIVEGLSVFFYSTSRPSEGLLPSQAYLEKLKNGYRKWECETHPVFRSLETQGSLPTMEPLFPPYFLFQDYRRYGAGFERVLQKYDAFCVKRYVAWLNRPALFR
jgi:hypothetical protein